MHDDVELDPPAADVLAKLVVGLRLLSGLLEDFRDPPELATDIDEAQLDRKSVV